MHHRRLVGKGHRLCHRVKPVLVPPGGPKPPGQSPPRPWRALLARRVGRWPLLLPDLPVYRAPSRAGGGNAGRVSSSRPGGSSVPGSARRSRLSMRPECPCCTRLMCPKDAKAKVRRDPGRGRLPQGARPQAKGVCTGAEGEIGGQIREEGGGSLPCARPKPAGRLRGPNPVRPLRRPDASFPRPFPARRERSRTGT